MTMWIAGAVFGVALWTLLEYALHRWVFHKRLLGKVASREHVLHHAKVDYFAPWTMKVALAVPILAVIVGLATLALGVQLGTSVPIGVLAGYGFYEVLHKRLHVRAPRNAYGRWARRHHLLHHFGQSNLNHGVTSPFWDIAFGTLAKPEQVRMPPQHVAKFPWLLDPAASTPAIAAPYVADYRIG